MGVLKNEGGRKEGGWVSSVALKGKQASKRIYYISFGIMMVVLVVYHCDYDSSHMISYDMKNTVLNHYEYHTCVLISPDPLQ